LTWNHGFGVNRSDCRLCTVAAGIDRMQFVVNIDVVLLVLTFAHGQ